MRPTLTLPRLWGALVVFLASVLWSGVVLRLPTKWWFEDDPGLYARLRGVNNALNIFLDPQVMRGFGAGKALTPLQILSFWSDVHLFGANPQAAYLHTMLAITMAMLVIYLVLSEWTGSLVAAVGGALLWMLLPSTMAVQYFISARHYVEGLSFALLTCWLAVRFCAGGSSRRWWHYACIALLGGCAILSKEIYATTLPAFLFILGLGRRRFALSALAIALVLFYSSYRLWVLGSDLTYTEPLLGLADYMRFLAVLPYTFTANVGGYLLYGCVGALAAAMLRWRPEQWQPTLAGALIFLAALVAIYAVAYPVLVTYETPGTWYRVPYIVNTVLVIWGTYMLAQLVRWRLQIVAITLVALLLLPGVYRTQVLWDARMMRAEGEGRFYLAHPDRLLYSEEDAWWFIMGVHELYNVTAPHYINKQFRIGGQARIIIPAYTTIWRYHDGTFVPDEQLYQTIKQENSP